MIKLANKWKEFHDDLLAGESDEMVWRYYLAFYAGARNVVKLMTSFGPDLALMIKQVDGLRQEIKEFEKVVKDAHDESILRN